MSEPGTTSAFNSNQFFGAGAPSSAAPAPALNLDAVFGTEPPVKSGWLADLSVAQSSVGRILHAFGQGAEDGWGSAPIAETPMQDFLRKQGGWEDYVKKQGSILKGFNEAIIRPAASALDNRILGPAMLGQRILGTVAASTEAGLEQSAQEAAGTPIEGGSKGIPYVGKPLGTVLGGAAEMLEWAMSTGTPELWWMPELKAAAQTNIPKARATAVIGEGEEGYFNARQPTEADIARRTEAAAEAGINPETVTKPQPIPTVDELARKVDPEAFAQYDDLRAQHADLLDQADHMAQERAATPEAQAAQAKIDTILGKVNGVETRLTKAARARLVDAQEELDSILRSTTPEMDAVNARRTEVGARMQPIYQRVRDAYNHAGNMLGESAGLEPYGAPAVPRIAEADHAGLDVIEADLDQQLAKLSPESYQEFTNEGVTIPVGAEQKTAGTLAEGSGKTGGRPGTGETGAQPAADRGAAPALGAEPEPSWGPGSGGALTAQPEYGRPAAAERGAATDLAFRETPGTGKLKPYGLAKNIEAKAIEHGLVNDFGADLPMRQAVSFADQAKRISALMGEVDEGTLWNMVMGREPIPREIVPQLLLNEVERIALREGDVEMLHDLANSPYVRQASEAGLTLRAARERDEFSPVNAISEVQNARKGRIAVERPDEPVDVAAATEEVPRIKAAIRAQASAKKLADFIASLQCEI